MSPHPAALATSLASHSGDGRWILPSLIKGSISEAGFIGREKREESGRFKSGKRKHPSPGGPIQARQDHPPVKQCCLFGRAGKWRHQKLLFLLQEHPERQGLYPGRASTCSEEPSSMDRRPRPASCGAGGEWGTLWQSRCRTPNLISARLASTSHNPAFLSTFLNIKEQTPVSFLQGKRQLFQEKCPPFCVASGTPLEKSNFQVSWLPQGWGLRVIKGIGQRRQHHEAVSHSSTRDGRVSPGSGM